MTTAKEEIESLRAELEKHNYNYYVLSQPTISDFRIRPKVEKSATKRKVSNSEYYDPNSPTQRVEMI